MLAGGIGYANAQYAQKGTPKAGDKIVVMGGDNYRIGMGGAAVSSADTGEFESGIELNAVQRSNPEMQKRVANAIRALAEGEINPIVSIHDHGAGGHLNCLSELVEETGGRIDMDKLPVGDPTLSAKELIGNESQERMGLVISPEDIDAVKAIADRERAPMYVVGDVTGDLRFSFVSGTTGKRPMDLALSDMFGSSPKTIMRDEKQNRTFAEVQTAAEKIQQYVQDVLRLEAVACKDWLTNKVDRCVGGLVAKQQCAGQLQLPLNDVGVMALDYAGQDGVATSIGHAPVLSLVDPEAGSRNAIAEALTNLVWAPLRDGLESVSLSANWMWPCKNPGEDARLYQAVQAVSDFTIALGINVPTGKDSLSMKQKYPDREVLAPGTVVISTVAHCDRIRQIVEPVFQQEGGPVYYLNLSSDSNKLGGSTFAQTQNRIGTEAPDILDAKTFKDGFNAIQELIRQGKVLAGHDISAGGLITTLLEMCFANVETGAEIDLSRVPENDIVKLLFAENSGVVMQATDDSIEKALDASGVRWYRIGNVTKRNTLEITHSGNVYSFDVPGLRDTWYETSWLLDQKQTANGLADERYRNYKNQPLTYRFPAHFTGTRPEIDESKKKPVAAVVREKGSNSEREMANALHLAGFEVRDVHMTDLITGRETLEDVQFLGAVGGFSNSDVLGSAKGWAGAFRYNEKARDSLKRFFDRDDVLSVGICNGCQLFLELDLLNPDHIQKSRMVFNDSHKHESAFTSVTIAENNSVMLSSLAGTTLGVWISHGEGKFHLPLSEDRYNIVGRYGYDAYPSNPNGSDYNTAMLCSPDGRHLATMPHIERSTFPWNWAYYPKGRQDEVSPWHEAFVNARKWLEEKMNA